MATAVHARVPIQVSDDRLRAEIIPAKVDPYLLTSESLLQRLGELCISINDDVKARVARLAESVSVENRPKEAFVLAEGRAAVEEIGAKVELAVTRRDLSEDDRADYYESQILTVQEGEVIGTLIPGVPGTPGVDVFGKQIPVATSTDSVEVGENIRLDADGKTLIATRAGKVHLTRRQICVLDVVEIRGDVDFSSGNIDSPADVLVMGTIRDTFAVKSTKSVAVRGAIEAATVEAGADVQVSGGIAGRNQGKVVAAGNIATRFCTEALLRAGGDLIISRECMNSQVHCQGRLLVTRGKLVGGFAFARQGAEIATLGNEAEKPTEIAVGLAPESLVEVMRINELVKKKAEAAAKIREKVQPLMAQLKRLTPQQREKATELMYQADELEADIVKQEARKRELLASANAAATASIVVTSIVYPGVKMIFGDKMTVFRKERKGPFKIERRLVNRIEEICVIERASGSVTTMPGHEYLPGSASPAGAP